MTVSRDDPFMKRLISLNPEQLEKEAGSTETTREAFYKNIQAHMQFIQEDSDLYEKAILALPSVYLTKESVTSLLALVKGDKTRLLNSLLCRATNPELIQYLIALGADVNSRDSKGLTPLDHAIGIGASNREAMIALLSAGAEVSKKNIQNLMSLNLDDLLNHMKDPVQKDNAKELVMKINFLNIELCSEKDAKRIIGLIDEGANMALDPIKKGLIYYLNNNFEMADQEIKKWSKDQDLNRVCKVLVELRPLVFYLFKNHKDVVDDILKALEPSEKVKFLNDCLLKTHNFETVKLLLERGAQIDAEDPQGNTALDRAIENVSSSPNDPLLNALLDQGAKRISTKSMEKVVGNDTLFLLFVDKGVCSVDMAGPDGVTPLMRACENKKVELIHALIARGANVNAIDRSIPPHQVLFYAIHTKPRVLVPYPHMELFIPLLKAGMNITDELVAVLHSYGDFFEEALTHMNATQKKAAHQIHIVLIALNFFRESEYTKADKIIERIIQNPDLLVRALAYEDLANYIYELCGETIDVSLQTAGWDDATKLRILPFLRPEEIQNVVGRIPAADRGVILSQNIPKLIPREGNELGEELPVKQALTEYAHRFLRNLGPDRGVESLSDTILTDARELLSNIPLKALALAFQDPEVKAVLQYYLQVMNRGQLKVAISQFSPEELVTFLRPFSPTIRIYVITCANQKQIEACIKAGLLIPNYLESHLKQINAWNQMKELSQDIESIQRQKLLLEQEIEIGKAGIENLRSALEKNELKITDEKLKKQIHSEIKAAKLTLEKIEKALITLEVKLREFKKAKTVEIDKRYIDPIGLGFIENPVVTLFADTDDKGKKILVPSNNIYDLDGITYQVTMGASEKTIEDLEQHPEGLKAFLAENERKDPLQTIRIVDIVPVSNEVKNEFLEAACKYGEKEAALALIRNGANITTDQEIEFLLKEKLLGKAIGNLKAEYLMALHTRLMQYEKDHVDLKEDAKQAIEEAKLIIERRF